MEKNGFRSRYQCGIEYIDGLRKLTREEFYSKEGGLFVASAYGLSVLLHQDDQTSLGTTIDGFYTYDFAVTFMLGNFHMNGLMNNSVVSRRVAWFALEDNLDRLCTEHTLLSGLKEEWSRVLHVTGKNYKKEKWEAFLKPVKLFPDVITDNRIEILTETIRAYYGGGEGEISYNKVKMADVLAWYYKKYLIKFRQMCTEVLDNKLDAIRNI